MRTYLTAAAAKVLHDPWMVDQLGGRPPTIRILLEASHQEFTEVRANGRGERRVVILHDSKQYGHRVAVGERCLRRQQLQHRTPQTPNVRGR